MEREKKHRKLSKKLGNTEITFLNKVVNVGFTEKVIFELRLIGSEGESHVAVREYTDRSSQC